MRGIAVVVLSLTVASSAQASSIVAVGGAVDAPSVVMIGEAAAISGPEPGHSRASRVLVIRAGVADSVSAAPAASSAKTASDGGEAPTLRDAMTQAGQAPAVPQ